MSRFIAIEGGDGSGKGTQTKLLLKHLEGHGVDAVTISFPRYGESSAYFLTEYLNGRYGDIQDVSADLASLAFAIDRYAAREAITKQLARPNAIVIADRYVSSNLAHQATIFSQPHERHAFYERIMHTEYDLLGVPKPDLNIVLTVPADIAQTNVDQKAKRTYTDRKRDIHEADRSHLELANRNYQELCQLYPKRFQRIDCMLDGQLRPIDDIQHEIRAILKV